MKKQDTIKYFGSATNLAKALDITLPSVSQWKNVIPEKQALKLEKITNGALRYDATLYVKTA
ncbi:MULTISPECIES: Cro/CI family transcriptional regulator [Vibrio]|uniref:Regulatory protein cro n=2 Tax=Vibrio TaxID=662 RepID=A0AAV2VVJ4_9VIBR|nr:MULTISPECIES: Cro/CI family transcriptional regulator [Vibrio]RTZ23269.1 hypothetical protein EKN09_09790 [Vibrio penaeicida]GLQ72700.1 hypothetical protein GCM10007932_20600 [Vibrio penaeicida]CCO48460.1 Regulatory protein cro [Vibrio nigripulchritudo SOn1]